jgi:hypothetical protein
VSDKKQGQAEKEIASSRLEKDGTPDKSQDELSLPIGADQGFVYYEE